MLLLYIASHILEFLIFVPFLWNIRRVLVPIILIMTSFASAALIVSSPGVFSCGVLLIAVFRILNMMRISHGRMHEAYLYRVTRRSSLWFVMYFMIFVVGTYSASHLLNAQSIKDLYIGLSIGLSAFIFFETVRNLYKTRHLSVLENYSDKELPTVTVAIPARNETLDLEDCIRSVLANNYPKLEVLVLDDCSQDKTPEIIRAFAHDGVSFIPGDEPNERWLAKNQAYERLYKSANGELILFCGVDVRFGPDTIRALVTTMMNRKKDMISVLPRRLSGSVLAAFIQPMRYWWELALPRRFFNRPPVLSTCWMIKRKTLKKLGGFAAISHAILPEGYFARETVKSDAYSFVRADDLLDVQTRKNLTEQRNMAVRVRYPQLRRRMELVLVLALFESVFLIGPLIFAVYGLWLGFDMFRLLALVSFIILILTHVVIVQMTNPPNVLMAMINLPLVLLTEFAIGLISMWQYEFGIIEWKDRNICIPVMHTIPRLPKI